MTDIKTLGEAVATAMGPDWTVTARDEAARGVTLNGPGEARLFFAPDWNKPDRLEIVGSYPKHYSIVGPAVCHRIGVAIVRGPETIAREITRRLLPVYEPELVRVRAALDRHERRKASTLTLATELAQIAGVDASRVAQRDDGSSRASFSLRHGEGYGDVEVSGDRTSIRLHNLTPEQARAIAKVLDDERTK